MSGNKWCYFTQEETQSLPGALAPSHPLSGNGSPLSLSPREDDETTISLRDSKQIEHCGS